MHDREKRETELEALVVWKGRKAYISRRGKEELLREELWAVAMATMNGFSPSGIVMIITMAGFLWENEEREISVDGTTYVFHKNVVLLVSYLASG